MHTIVLVDSDLAFLDRLKTKIAEEEIADKYQFHLLCPNTNLEKPQLIDDCLRAVNDLMFSEHTVIGIFVDIVIIEGGKRLDFTGIDIASELKRNYPSLPIFNITGKYSDDESDTDIISAATLENSDGVLLKSYLEGKYFSGKRLRTIFEKAKSKTTERQDLIHVGNKKDRLPDHLKQSYSIESLDSRVAFQISQMGATEFWSLLLRLLPDSEGIVSYMRPGRSGAWMFKVNSKFVSESDPNTRPKAWAVKVSNQSDQIERELINYADLAKTPLPRSFYPKPFGDGIKRVGNLTGFAIELEGDASALLTSFSSYSENEVSSLVEFIGRFIKETYGDSVKRICHPWKDYFSLNASSILRIAASLEGLKDLLLDTHKPQYEEVVRFVKTNGSLVEPITNYEIEVDLRTVHGDLNAGNLLVKKDGQMVVIDFASRGKNHVAKDVAKLERDVVFKVYDSNSRNFYDWSRAAEWREFLRFVKNGSIFSEVTPNDDTNADLKRSFSFINGIRRVLKQESSDLSESEYLMALLHYSLLAIAHPDISVQKRVFGVEYANNIINCLVNR